MGMTPLRPSPLGPSPLGASPLGASDLNKSLPSLGIYIHWPFCSTICPYCDFNVYKARQIDDAQWRQAYVQDLSHAAHRRPEGPVKTVFFGGGTPSLMAGDLVADLLAQIDRLWGLEAGAEITLEANPEHVTPAYTEALRQAGITRLSLGLQALQDDALAFLGRHHSAASARQAIEVTRRFFENYNLDLIYGRPGQSCVAWEKELTDILSYTPPHLSLYELTIEPDTAFGYQYKRGALIPPADDLRAELYCLTQELCQSANMPAYEVSNYARAGYACRHNYATWQGGDYVGIGPGAHGRLTYDTPKGRIRHATLAHARPHDWLQSVAQQGHGLAQIDRLSEIETAQERVLLGMRLLEGVAYQPDLGVFNDAQILALIEDGYLLRDGDYLRATQQGRLVLDHLLGIILN